MKVIDEALKYLNEKEKSGNQGFYNSELEILLKNNGWSIGQPYCAYFVRAMYTTAYPDQKTALKRIIQGGTQYTLSLAKSDKTGFCIFNNNAQVGDIAVWTTYKNGIIQSSGHVGLVTEVRELNFSTIEANTGALGGREGDGIYAKERTYDFNKATGLRLQGFIHFNLI